MISYAPSDSLVDEQGMISQECTLWDSPGKRKTDIASFISPEHRSNNCNKNCIFGRPYSRLTSSRGVGSGALPKSDRTQKGEGQPPVATIGREWPCGTFDHHCILFLGLR
jgi:hypothetical protein